MTQVQSRLSLIVNAMRDWSTSVPSGRSPALDQPRTPDVTPLQGAGGPAGSSARAYPPQPGEEIDRRRHSSQAYRSFWMWPLLLPALGLMLALVSTPSIALAQPPEPHQYIQEYKGAATCETCHGDVTGDVVHSVHYSWTEKMDHYTPLTASIPRINWLGVLNEKLDIPSGCGRCHVGDGSLPKPADQVTAEDKAGIDCLICHSPVYDTSLRFPVQDSDGEWKLTQDRGVLTARQAQRPAAENCLLCHQNVGGGPMLEGGMGLSPVADTHGEASKDDVHADAGMVCVDCHASQDHKTLGFSPDLWSRDLPDERLTCQQCHTEKPHQDPLIDQHTRLDCRTCHIPATGGLVNRDWTAPAGYDPVTEIYSPQDDVREPNSVTPLYLWHNGQPAVPGEPWPGKRSELSARIQPFKVFSGTVPVDARSGEPVPLKLDTFYAQGDLEKAIQQGAEELGMSYSGQWEPNQLTTNYQISHGVVGKQKALACQECHVPNGRIDFGQMGYTSEEVAMLTTVSSAAAGPRQPLQMEVIVPAAKPLPTPVSLSGDLQSKRGVGVRVPWSPLLALVVILAIAAGAFLWLRRQKPKPPAQQA